MKFNGSNVNAGGLVGRKEDGSNHEIYLRDG